MPTAAATDFDRALAGFFRAARHARGRAAQRGDTGELTLAQYHLVEPLLDGSHTLSRLAAAAGVAAPTASRMLEALVARGLVERARDRQDRRAVNLSLTPAGLAAAREKSDQIRAARARMAGVLDDSEQRAMADLLTRLAGVLEEL